MPTATLPDQNPPAPAAPGDLGAGVSRAYFMTGYPKKTLLISFLDVSYEGGIAYKTGRDAAGHNILIEHEQEFPDLTGELAVENLFANQARTEGNITQSRYYRRVRCAAYENHIRPIVDKFSAYLLRNSPKRDEKAVGPSVPRIKLDEKIRQLVDGGLKLSEYWLGVDAKNLGLVPGQTLTVEQVRAIDPENEGNAYLVLIDPRNIVDYDLINDEGECSRVVVMETEVTKAGFSSKAAARVYFKEWTADGWTRYAAVKQDGSELKLDAAQPNVAGTVYVRKDSEGTHTFGRCPIRRFRPPFPIEDICELNRAIFNASSLLDQELWNSTFTMRAFYGVRPDDLRKVVKGSGMYLAFENANAKSEALGGLTEQSRAIQERIDALRDALYQIVSLDASRSKNVAEAAEKKKRDMEALYTCLVKIIGHVEDAENWALRVMGLVKDDGQETTYGKTFDVTSLVDLMDDLAKVSGLAFATPSLKRALVGQLIQKIDPAGDHEQYIKDASGAIDLTPGVVDGLVALRGVGLLTPEIAAVMLGVPPDKLAAFIEGAAGHDQPQDLGGTGGGDGQPVVEDGTDQGAGAGGPGGVAGGGSGGAEEAGAAADGP